MKTRIPILLLALACVLSLASCYSGSPHHLYNDFLQTLEETGGMSATTRTVISYKIGDEVNRLDTSLTVRYNGDRLYVFSNEVESIYTDGTMYMSHEGSKLKKQSSFAEFEKYAGLSSIYLQFPEISKEAVKKTMLTESGDSRFFTVKLDPTAMQEFALDVYRKLLYVENDTELADVTVSAVVVTPTFDRDGNIAKLHVKCEYRQSFTESNHIDVTIDMYYAFVDFGTAPNVEAPADADAYLTIDHLE